MIRRFGAQGKSSYGPRGPRVAREATHKRDLVPRPLRASRLTGFRSIDGRTLPPGLSAFMALAPPAGRAAALAAGHRSVAGCSQTVTAAGHGARSWHHLHELLAKRRQRPVLDLLGQGQRAHEVGQILRLAWTWSRTALLRNVQQDSRVHLSAFLPSWICCSAVPRWL
jgi:hypothetical protein